MRLELNPALVSEFEERMTLHPDWMHPYRFGEKLITGNFKYQGVPNGLTFVNSRSSPENIAVMQRAYEAEKFTHRADFYRKLCEFIPERETSTALDIASATGQFSLALCENGFKRVISSEIRQAQVAQFDLILSCAKDRSYSQKILGLHDPVSADDPSFPDRYKDHHIDCAFSMGLLYHLTNPVQHLSNLAAITAKYAVIYTMTHSNVFAQNKWTLTLENPSWITKAVGGVSWTPFFLDLPKLLKNVGFKKVSVVYPDLFERNFHAPSAASRSFIARYLSEIAIHQATGLRLGWQRNFDPDYYKYAGLNPNYFAYVCEK